MMYKNNQNKQTNRREMNRHRAGEMGRYGRTDCSHEAGQSKSDVYALQPQEPGHERQEVACWFPA